MSSVEWTSGREINLDLGREWGTLRIPAERSAADMARGPAEKLSPDQLAENGFGEAARLFGLVTQRIYKNAIKLVRPSAKAPLCCSAYFIA